MDGADALAPGSAHRHVVRLKDGTLLNRYWDDRDIPREESYREDVNTAKAARRPPDEVYRDLRAAAESGWDFSSRWLEDGRTLSTIRTTDFVPVDLNSFMVKLETTLAQAYAAARKPEKAAELNARAELRKSAVRRYLWDADKGIFTDYLWREEKPSGTLTAATSRAPVLRCRHERAGRARGAGGPRPIAEARRARHNDRVDRPAVGCPERLGAAAVDRDRGSERLRRDRARRDHCRAMDAQGDRRLSCHRQAHGEIQCGGPFARDRRWRIPDARWLAGPTGCCASSWCFTRTRSPRAPVRAGVRPRRPTTTCRRKRAGRPIAR